MITLGGFFLGLAIMGIGFLMIWKHNQWRQNVGSLRDLVGYPNIPWLDWGVLGVVLLAVGLLIAFGLLQLFITLTFGRFFQLPNLR
jgi:hypothetical protein